MSRLESIERDVEQKQREFEQKAEEIESNVQELDHKIMEIQSALQSMSEDQEVRDRVSQNLNEREGEKQQELRKAEQLQSDLDALSTQITEFESINNTSKSEVRDLQAIGENVGDAMSIVAERESWISDRNSNIDSLRKKLANLR